MQVYFQHLHSCSCHSLQARRSSLATAGRKVKCPNRFQKRTSDNNQACIHGNEVHRCSEVHSEKAKQPTSHQLLAAGTVLFFRHAHTSHCFLQVRGILYPSLRFPKTGYFPLQSVPHLHRRKCCSHETMPMVKYHCHTLMLIQTSSIRGCCLHC